MSNFKGRAIKRISATAQPIVPKREECLDLTDVEFADFYTEYENELAEWETEQKLGKVGNTSDAKNGPGATGWVNHDSVTGPGMQIQKDKTTGPGVK